MYGLSVYFCSLCLFSSELYIQLRFRFTCSLHVPKSFSPPVSNKPWSVSCTILSLDKIYPQLSWDHHLYLHLLLGPNFTRDDDRTVNPSCDTIRFNFSRILQVYISILIVCHSTICVPQLWYRMNNITTKWQLRVLSLPFKLLPNVRKTFEHLQKRPQVDVFNKSPYPGALQYVTSIVTQVKTMATRFKNVPSLRSNKTRDNASEISRTSATTLHSQILEKPTRRFAFTVTARPTDSSKTHFASKTYQR